MLTTCLLHRRLRRARDARQLSFGIYFPMISSQLGHNESDGTTKQVKLSVKEAMKPPNGRKIILKFNSEL
ncbi:hypothetical protein AHAS_Ahas20G0119900 [Arachis hypogaea]